MAETPVPTLEDLRQAGEPAWLWDGAHGRIVWANAAGIAAFDGRSLFDLVDRPFDPREPGVQRVTELCHSLDAGQSTTALLHFPSTGMDVPLECQCHPHALADGRPGLLVVRVPAPRVPAAAPEAVAALALDSLPEALLMLAADGHFLFSNAQARRVLAAAGHVADLAGLLQSPARAQALLGRLVGASMTSSTEQVNGPSGSRDLKLTLWRLPAGSAAHASLLVEDVTERRQLERQMMGAGAAPATAAPPPAAVAPAPVAEASPATSPADAAPAPQQSKADAFEALSRSLQATIRRQADDLEQQAAPPARRAAAPAVVRVPFVPPPVRQSLENMGEAILIGRDGTALFASRKAVSLLQHGDEAAVLADERLWQALASAGSAAPCALPTATGEDLFSISAASIPWHSGPAQQWVLRAAPAAAQPVQAKPAPAAPVAIPPEASVAPAVPASTADAAPAPPAEPIEIAPAPTAAVEDAPDGTAAAAAAALAAAMAALAQPESTDAAVHDAVADDELRAILDVASDGIITLDRDGRILSFSAGAEAIFGLNFSEVIDRPLADLLTPESRKSLRDYLAALGGPGLASVFNDGREVTAATRQGGAVPLFLTVGKLLTPKSRAAFCAVVRDITPWKRTEQELRDAKDQAEAASRQKSEFLARVSHELRTPLNAIMGFSEVMRMERFGELRNDKYRAYANDIHASGEQLLALINDLLDLSKVEAGKLELDFTAVAVDDAVENAVRLLQEQATHAHVLVRKSLPPRLPRVVADRRSLRQIMLNLLSNAIKYTNGGGQVIVSASVEPSGALTLRVKDTGIGMNEKQLAEALQPFTRVDTPGRERQGTGLGLPLTKALVEANRAALTMSSQPGKGTLAEVTFPGTRVLAE